MKQFGKMIKKGTGSFLSLFLVVVIAGVIFGCSKEKAGELKATAPAGTCDVSEKLSGDIKKPLAVKYGNKIELVGITAEKSSQDQLKVIYFWHILDEVEPYHQVFVHIVDSNNIPLFQNDHTFCEKQSLKDLKGKYARETYVISVPKSAAGKEGYFKVGLYAPDTKGSPRLNVESAGGVPTDEDGTRAMVEKVNF